jgi:integrase
MHSWELFLKISGWTSEYASVDAFLRHYSHKLKSEKTRENVCLCVKGFCVFAKMNPDELVARSSGEASKLVQGYVDSLVDKGFSVRYANVQLSFLQVFFRVNGFKGEKALETERHYMPARYMKRSEYIPTSAEIYDMALAAGSLRNKALVLLLYTSGLRNSTLRALLYRDVKEELEKGSEITKIPVYPEMKKIDAGACKGNISYFSFASKETAQTLRQYCSERKEKCDCIGDDEPLFIPERRDADHQGASRRPMIKKSLEDVVKKAARIAGIRRWKDVNPHCLRKEFEFALRSAGLDTKDQEFLMGHILPGSQDAYYNRTKIDYLRGKYAQVVFFPERAYTDNDLRKRQILDTARLLGYSEDKIKRIEDVLARYERPDEALEEIRKLNLDPNGRDRKSDGADPANGHGQRKSYKIIKGERDLVDSLNSGWNLVKELPEDKFILKRDNQNG